MTKGLIKSSKGKSLGTAGGSQFGFITFSQEKASPVQARISKRPIESGRGLGKSLSAKDYPGIGKKHQSILQMAQTCPTAAKIEKKQKAKYKSKLSHEESCESQLTP